MNLVLYTNKQEIELIEVRCKSKVSPSFQLIDVLALLLLESKLGKCKIREMQLVLTKANNGTANSVRERVARYDASFCDAPFEAST